MFVKSSAGAGPASDPDALGEGEGLLLILRPFDGAALLLLPSLALTDGLDRILKLREGVGSVPDLPLPPLPSLPPLPLLLDEFCLITAGGGLALAGGFGIVFCAMRSRCCFKNKSFLASKSMSSLLLLLFTSIVF